MVDIYSLCVRPPFLLTVHGSKVNCFTISFIFLLFTSAQISLTYRKGPMNSALDSESKPCFIRITLNH